MELINDLDKGAKTAIKSTRMKQSVVSVLDSPLRESDEEEDANPRSFILYSDSEEKHKLKKMSTKKIVLQRMNTIKTHYSKTTKFKD